MSTDGGRVREVPERMKGGLSFLRTELKVGLTFAALAANAKCAEKVARNRVNARKALDAARRYIGCVPLTADEAAELREKVARLDHNLQLLDDSV